jgi:hypothetical protein
MKDERRNKILKCGMVYYNNSRPKIKKVELSEIFTKLKIKFKTLLLSPLLSLLSSLSSEL